MTATVDFSPVRDALLAACAEAADEAAEQTADDARAGASRRTGALADSVHVDDTAAQDGPPVFRRRVVADAEHASYVDEGTGIHGPRGAPYTVEAAPGGVLAFYWDAVGRQFYVKRVTIEGMEGTRFFTKAAEAWPDRLADALRSRLG